MPLTGFPLSGGLGGVPQPLGAPGPQSVGDVTLFLEWGGDLVVGPTAGLLLAAGWDAVRQRIMRKLFTNPRVVEVNGNIRPPGYIFDPQFGCGLGSRVGSTPSDQELATIVSQLNRALSEDPAADPGVPPVIQIRKTASHYVYVIAYCVLANGQQGVVALKVG